MIDKRAQLSINTIVVKWVPVWLLGVPTLTERASNGFRLVAIVPAVKDLPQRNKSNDKPEHSVGLSPTTNAQIVTVADVVDFSRFCVIILALLFACSLRV